MREGARVVAGVDEVGRGALAGPVAVGAVAIDADTGPPPVGLRDSKQLSAAARDRLAPQIRSWAAASAVGLAGPEEIDAFGLMAALRLASARALLGCGLSAVDVVLLDGTYDFIGCDPAVGTRSEMRVGRVITGARADNRWSTVAAASIIAKAARDALMVELAGTPVAAQDDPYGWRRNKGYAAPEHRRGLLRWGPSAHHRLSWRLLGPAPPLN